MSVAHRPVGSFNLTQMDHFRRNREPVVSRDGRPLEWDDASMQWRVLDVAGKCIGHILPNEGQAP